MTPSRLIHGSSGGEQAAGWIIQLGRGERCLQIVAAGDQDGAVAEEGRGLASARLPHRPGAPEQPGSSVINFGRSQRPVRPVLIATSEQHPAVRQEGRRGVAPGHRHVAGRRENAGGGPVNFRGVDVGSVVAAGDQDGGVRQQRGGVVAARHVHGSGQREGSGRGVVKFGRGQGRSRARALIAPGNQDPTVPEQCHRRVES